MRPLFQVILLLTVMLQVSAQDAVPVSMEPMHKNVFENAYLRVLDVRIPPGDTTMFHKHETPSVFISLHPVRTGSQVIVEDGSASVLSLDRRITFEGFYKSPRIHRVWNRDTAEFHVMDVEILTKGDSNAEAAVAMDGFTQLFDAPPVRTYRLTLKPNQKIDFMRKAPILLVALNDSGNALVNKKSFSRRGDYLFVQPSQKIEVANTSEQEYSFTILEMK